MVSQAAPNSERGKSPTPESVNPRLNLPHTPTDHVVREQLLAQLQAAAMPRLCLLCAPAGYGKTSLAAAAVQRSKRAAWLALTAHDSDPLRFWQTVIAAMHNAAPHAFLHTEGLVAQANFDPRLLARALTDDAAALDQPTVFVLDNYQLIQAAVIHETIAEVLANLPSPLHVWIITRSEPPFNLARLRANGHLLELRQDDLRLSPEETNEFLRRHVRRALTGDEVMQVYEHTQGWAAGLRLAALRLNTSVPVHQAVDGQHRNYIDYFEEEVLRHQPKSVRDFLLRTSILDRLSTDNTGAVTQVENTSAILTELERTHCFIAPIDKQHFRYHPQFAESLQALLQMEQPHSIPELHRRAAQWYAENQQLDQAIDHAFAGRLFEDAVKWVKREGKRMLVEGVHQRLRRWLDQIPQQYMRTDLRLRLLDAWLRLLEGRWELLEADVEGLKAEAFSPDNAPLLGELHALHARIALLRLEFAQVKTLATEALLLLPDESVLLRGLAELTQGSAAYLTGDINGALNAFADAQRGDEADRQLIQLIKLANCAYIYAQRGQLQLARETYDRAAAALHLSPHKDHLRLVTGVLATGMGELELEWNRLEAAEYHLREGQRICLPWRQLVPHMPGYFLLAKARALLGDVAGAREAIHLLEDEIYAAPYRFPLTYLRGLAVQFELTQGNLDAARHWQRTSGLTVHDQPQPMFTFEYFTLARIMLAQRQPEGIVKLFDSLLFIARMLGFPRATLEMLLLQALALDMQGEFDSAHAKVIEALRLAEPEDYRRIFLDKGEAMKRLLLRVRDDSRTAYVSTLLADFAREVQLPSESRLILLRPIIAEPLSERELDVLRLIALGYSNKQIAEHLVIGEGTVKTHVKGILRKLGTQNRTEAAARARQLGLLDA